MTNHALFHRGCGHTVGVANHRPLLEDQLRLLQAAGYHQLRIRILAEGTEVEQAIAETLSADRAACTTCKIDPLRGLLPDALKVAAEIHPLQVHRA